MPGGKAMHYHSKLCSFATKTLSNLIDSRILFTQHDAECCRTLFHIFFFLGRQVWCINTSAGSRMTLLRFRSLSTPISLLCHSRSPQTIHPAHHTYDFPVHFSAPFEWSHFITINVAICIFHLHCPCLRQWCSCAIKKILPPWQRNTIPFGVIYDRKQR